MASIFTYDPEPPRVASPWLRASASDPAADQTVITEQANGHLSQFAESQPPPRPDHGSSAISRLDAEPQEGPVEYKLHLLLRPRRKFRSTSTHHLLSTPRHSKPTNNEASRRVSEPVFHAAVTPDGRATPPSSSSTQQTRQHRLEQVTTQLLWRLQQSSPHHASSASNIILPSLPDALPELKAPQKPGKLLHGLEESRGALYEIGVADDGALVGLAEDEMEESLNNLRAMAACLGCTVQVMRKECVGNCEWAEEISTGGHLRQRRHVGKLVVVEALVTPYLLVNGASGFNEAAATGLSTTSPQKGGWTAAELSTEQLRITLTGPTMSGKSTLLGTLTTSTLDNGRGKSRLSMLKHRHEINSGITSSVTQELLGFRDAPNGNVEIVNYATENVSSWIDVHVASSGDRLVFICDSAGHPRYRRTTVRGLIGWDPHWTMLCIPADDTENIVDPASNAGSSQHHLAAAVADLDLSGAQLGLCLKLRLPLVVVITKLDLACRTGLKSTLSKVLDTLKAAGRRPAILANAVSGATEHELQSIEAPVIDTAYNTALPLLNDLHECVPIVLTSAVTGTGISNLQGLLHELPIPVAASDLLSDTGPIFYIEDVYNKPADTEGIIVSGRLRSGTLSVGDCGIIGPFSTLESDDSEDSDERPLRKSSVHLPISRSFPGALRDHRFYPQHVPWADQEWRRFTITGVRNLRNPVRALQSDQVGTLAIVTDSSEGLTSAACRRIRKGMIFTTAAAAATRTFVAKFKREDLDSLAVGNHVVIYSASVRASARVISARAPDSPDGFRNFDANFANVYAPSDTTDQSINIENDNYGNVKVAGENTASHLLVTLRLESTKEFILVGDQVLVMPGGGPGLYIGQERGQKGVAGLEGFVGRIVEVFG